MRYLVVCLLAGALYACHTPQNDYVKVIHDPALYSKVTGQLIDVITYDIFTPPVASRVQAYAHLAAYEVITRYDSNYTSLEGQLKDLPKGSIPNPPAGAQIDFPFAAMKAYIHVGNALTFSKDKTDSMIQSLDSLAIRHGMPKEMIRQSSDYGIAVGNAILDWSKKDNYAETRSAPKYTVTNADSSWIPTPPGYFQGVEPQWKSIRTIAIGNPSTFLPSMSIIKFSREKGSSFDHLVHQVYDSVNALTDAQKAIANFWDCNGFRMNVVGHLMYATKAMTPGDHWMGITGIISKNQHADFDKTVYAYASVAAGIMDGF
ncbi:MAG TPA: hypothetical protein VG842_10925, partial [Sediminibacterium sp.]|nr:hypothetical protein [Sediminibacterium sp.]